MNIGSLPALHARYRGDHLAVVFGDERLTYREFNTRINRLSDALIRSGIGKGTHIATILPNCIELLELYWASAKIGAVVVPSSTLLQEAGLRTLLNNSDTEIVFSTPALQQHSQTCELIHRRLTMIVGC
jgi:long-chain acyl-CoA synthetase